MELTTGKVIGCDFVISATGTCPDTSDLSKFAHVSHLIGWLVKAESTNHACGCVV